MRAWVLAAAVVGCSGKTESSPPVPSSLPAPAEPEPEPDVQPDFPEGTRSLQLRRTIGVRLEPAGDAKRIGTVGIDTRVAWVRTQVGRGCDRPWIEIRPRGWICGDHVQPNTRPPFGQEVPRLDRGEIVPGIYGKVTVPGSMTYVLDKPEKKPARKGGKPGRREAKKDGRAEAPSDQKSPDGRPPAPPPAPKMVEGRPLVGSVNVRQYEEVIVGGRPYWKIDRKNGEYVLRQAVTPHRPSAFGGARLGDDTGWTVPIAFVWPRHRALQAVTTNTALGGGIHRQLAARTPLPILEIAPDRAGKPAAYRIGPAEWIAAADVRLFQPAPPPPMLLPGERWIDIDLDDQILVAYEGDLAVYATLVSSGSAATPTETGVYRMWLKEAEADMKGLSGEDPYSVATVPWTQFFSPENGLALHTAYWHDQFGTRLSHGCVNLAPRDARWLYFWSDPQVPPGWTMAAGMVESPGSIVRVRSKDDPEPEARGYAKKVLEARRQSAPVDHR